MMRRVTLLFLCCVAFARAQRKVVGPLLNTSQELIASWQPASGLGCSSVNGVDEEEAFYWADDEETVCGSPSARPFILAKHGAVLSLEDLKVEGRLVSSVVRACAPSVRPSAGKLRFGFAGLLEAAPWTTLASCQRAELGLVGRVVLARGGGIVAASVTPAHTETSCAWRVEAEVPYLTHTLEASLEVTLEHINGLKDPTKTCGTISDFDFKEQNPAYLRQIDFSAAVGVYTLQRGSPFMTCCDRCALYEECDVWRSTGGGNQHCFLYTMLHDSERRGSRDDDDGGGGSTANWRQTFEQRYLVKRQQPATQTPGKNANPLNTPSRPLTGFRKLEDPPAVYLGGNVNFGDGWKPHWGPCRAKWAHVFKSPMELRFSSSSSSSSSSEKRQWCTVKDIDSGRGWWAPETEEKRLIAKDLMANYLRRYPDSGGKFLAYATPQGSALNLTWEPLSVQSNLPCELKHYDHDSLRSCLVSKNYDKIALSGDSTVGGFSVLLKWVMGALKDPTAPWYEERTEKEHFGIHGANIPGTKVAITSLQGLRFDSDSAAKALLAAAVPGKRVVALFNLAIQHVIWAQPLPEIKLRAELLGRTLREARAGLDRRQNEDLQLVFLNGFALHGQREPYCTLERSREASQVIADALRPAGVLVLDAFNVTLPRPDGSSDGMHYGDTTFYSLAQILFNFACNDH